MYLRYKNNNKEVVQGKRYKNKGEEEGRKRRRTTTIPSFVTGFQFKEKCGRCLLPFKYSKNNHKGYSPNCHKTQNNGAWVLIGFHGWRVYLRPNL
jgi:hypothetical protein